MTRAMLLGPHLWLGDNCALPVDEDDFEGVELPPGFRSDLLAALKSILNKSLDFGGTHVAVKRELAGAEPVRLKTAGVPWSYSFVATKAPAQVLTFAPPGSELYTEVRVVPCKLVLKCLATKKNKTITIQ